VELEEVYNFNKRKWSSHGVVIERKGRSRGYRSIEYYPCFQTGKRQKIDKLKEELEERLEIKRTMDKLNEMDHMRYMSGQPYMPPQY